MSRLTGYAHSDPASSPLGALIRKLRGLGNRLSISRRARLDPARLSCHMLRDLGLSDRDF